MQRQSLGSPGLTRHHHPQHSSSPVADDDDDVEKKRRRSRSGSSSPGPPLEGDDVDESKLDKPVRTGTEKSIHLIPLLTVLCFLVLYIFSRVPSPKDMESFGTFERGMESQGAAATGMGRLIGTEVTMRSYRRLKGISRGWRKLGSEWPRWRAGDGQETRAVGDAAARVRRTR